MADSTAAARSQAGGYTYRAAVLTLLRWPKARLARVLNKHEAIVFAFVANECDLPGVDAWLDLISAPLRRWPSPKKISSSEPAIDGAELSALLEAMHWTRSNVASFTDVTRQTIERMEQDHVPVPGWLAQWLRQVTAPIRAQPWPDGWRGDDPDSATIQESKTRGEAMKLAISRATPEERRRLKSTRVQQAAELDDGQRSLAEISRELGINVTTVLNMRHKREELAAGHEAASRLERQAQQERRKALALEDEARRIAAQEESGLTMLEARRLLRSERARRVAELDNGQRTVAKIAWELGISITMVLNMRHKRERLVAARKRASQLEQQVQERRQAQRERQLEQERRQAEQEREKRLEQERLQAEQERRQAQREMRQAQRERRQALQSEEWQEAAMQRREAVLQRWNRADPEERRRLRAERIRRVAELDDGQRTIAEIAWELGISVTMVLTIRRNRAKSIADGDPAPPSKKKAGTGV